MSQEQMAALRKSMETFGYLAPIVVDQDNLIADGEHRVLIYKEFKKKTVPAFRVQMNDTERRLYRQTANKLRGIHNLQMDADEMALIYEKGRLTDLAQLLATQDQTLKDMMLRYRPELPFGHEDDAELDQIIDEQLKRTAADTKLGDIIQLGNHRLICADCTDKRSIDKLLQGNKVDICFTSPPYNTGKGVGTADARYERYEDNLPDEQYLELLKTSINQMFECCHEVYYNIMLFGANKIAFIEFLSWIKDNLKDVIYWRKKHSRPDANPGNLQREVELILILDTNKTTRKSIRHYNFDPSGLSNVIEGNQVNVNEFSEEHRATFPLYLPKHIISNCTYPKDSVIDPFAGTGTTLIACETTDRIGYAIELDPHYCDVIVKRWEAYTNQKATRL